MFTIKYKNEDKAEDILIENGRAIDEGDSSSGFVRIFIGRFKNGNKAIVFKDGTVYFGGLNEVNQYLEKIEFKSVLGTTTELVFKRKLISQKMRYKKSAKNLSEIDSFLQEKIPLQWERSGIKRIYSSASNTDRGWISVEENEKHIFNEGWNKAASFLDNYGYTLDDIDNWDEGLGLEQEIKLSEPLKDLQGLPKKERKLYKKELNQKSKRVRTDEQLASGGLKEKMYLFLRKAYNNENKNFRKGGGKPKTAFKGVKKLYTSKLPSAVFARAGKEDGKYWNLKDNDMPIILLSDDIMDAKDDIINKKWTPQVQKAMNRFLDISKGSKDDTTVLKDLTL